MLGQMDVFADNALPESSDEMMPGFLVEEGRGHLALSILATARPSCIIITIEHGQRLLRYRIKQF